MLGMEVLSERHPKIEAASLECAAGVSQDRSCWEYGPTAPFRATRSLFPQDSKHYLRPTSKVLVLWSVASDFENWLTSHAS
jgi:hypothetical protein